MIERDLVLGDGTFRGGTPLRERCQKTWGWEGTGPWVKMERDLGTGHSKDGWDAP